MFRSPNYLAIALSGIVGVVFLGLYFGIGAALGLAGLPPGAPAAEVLRIAIQYHNMWLLGAWLQATGSLLSVIFFLGLAHLAGGSTRLAGTLTLLGSAVLLGVVLIEGAFTMDLAQAAADGHQAASVTSFDVMTVFTHIYPIVPAPVIFLSLGTVLLGSRLLPRIFGSLAVALGCIFAVVGLVGLFTTPILTLIPLGLQSLWIVAAAIALFSRSDKTAPTPGTPQPEAAAA
jgi:hypothetical protein